MSTPARARVYNDKDTAHSERFKGDMVTIPANGYVEMEFFDAHEFKGQFTPIIKDADGGQDPKSFKKIRVETTWKPDVIVSDKPTCQACKYEATSKQDLEDHIDANHLEALEDKTVADKRRKAKSA